MYKIQPGYILKSKQLLNVRSNTLLFKSRILTSIKLINIETIWADCTECQNLVRLNLRFDEYYSEINRKYLCLGKTCLTIV